MNEEARRIPPLPVKRAVRQASFFGCVLCGEIPYEYDHLDGWKNGHDRERIALLCTGHHRERTNGLLPIKKVERAMANPHNAQRDLTKPHELHYEGSEFEFRVGSNWVSYPLTEEGQVYPALALEGRPLVSFRIEDGEILLSAELQEQGETVLKIEDNWLQYKPQSWDVTFTGQQFSIMRGSRDTLISIRFEPPTAVVIEEANLRAGGVDIAIRRNGIFVPALSAEWVGNSFHGFGVVNVGKEQLPGYYAWVDTSRVGC